MNVQELKTHANNIRKNILTGVYHAQSGHPGGSLSAADILTYLYFEVMDINEENVSTIDRDRFVLSKGHVTPALYSVLIEKGLLKEDIRDFRKFKSPLQGHPNMNYIDAVDMSTGSLGQGASCAVGMALANKLDGNSHHVYALLGDGECQEGQIWEAFMSAAHYKLDNLTLMVDCNHLQIDGNVEDVMNIYPMEDKMKAFGFEVYVADGHDFEEIAKAFAWIKTVEAGKPTAILWNTIKGKGVSYMENVAGWHGSAPKEDLYLKGMAELEENA